jgi:hypothetical protein
MSTAFIGRYSGAAVTIHKGADRKAQPQRVKFYKKQGNSLATH